MTLPAGILGGLDAVTIETWATFPGAINPNANLFAFGRTDTTALGSQLKVPDMNYIPLARIPAVPDNVSKLRAGCPWKFAGERNAAVGGVLDNQTNVHIVVVYRPSAGYEAFYTNGVLAATISMFNILIDPVALISPVFTNHSVLNYQLANDPINDGLGR